jgi:hypothetical protein
MRYPKDFPSESRAAVAAEKLRAAKDFDDRTQGMRRSIDVAAEVRRYILRQFSVFVREACKLGHRGIWHVDYIEKAALEFLRLATIEGASKGHFHYWISDWGGSIKREVQRQFEQSAEWRQYQEALLQVAESQASPGSNSADPGALAKRGYRAEVRRWMARESMSTLEEASKCLAISSSALKSIMSDRGNGDLWLCGSHRVLCGDATDAESVSRLLGKSEPLLMVTDPPYGIELDSEWRDRAGLNGCGPAEPSYLKHRTKGHRVTSISGDTRADWSAAFALVPSLQVRLCLARLNVHSGSSRRFAANQLSAPSANHLG